MLDTPFIQSNKIDMDPHFYENLLKAPLESFYPAMKGGTTIALASTFYYLLFGGILGMSGLTGSVVKFPQSIFPPIKDRQQN